MSPIRSTELLTGDGEKIFLGLSEVFSAHCDPPVGGHLGPVRCETAWSACAPETGGNARKQRGEKRLQAPPLAKRVGPWGTKLGQMFKYKKDPQQKDGSPLKSLPKPHST